MEMQLHVLIRGEDTLHQITHGLIAEPARLQRFDEKGRARAVLPECL
jgi:hypothetical protein